jgi:hypothetical protein
VTRRVADSPQSRKLGFASSTDSPLCAQVLANIRVHWKNADHSKFVVAVLISRAIPRFTVLAGKSSEIQRWSGRQFCPEIVGAIRNDEPIR